MAQSYLYKRGKQSSLIPANAIWALELGILRTIWGLSRRLGVDRGSSAGSRILRFVGPKLAKNRHVVTNLRTALPHLDTAGAEALAAEVWGQIGRVLAEYPHLETICGAESERRIEVVEHYDMEPIRSGERRAIFVSAHTANWELAAGAARSARFRLSVIYSPQTNPLIEETLQRQREALGCNFIERRHGARGILRAVEGGANVGVLLDQRYDEGVPIPFFGRPTPSGIGAAALAIKLGVDYVPVEIERLEGAHFRITFHEALAPDPTLAGRQEQAIDLTARAYRLFERWISARPEQWLCLKRRWPKSKAAEQVDSGKA